MAQLREILGALLQDIAQARLASDLYVRDISRQYEGDPILRCFPTPRPEIMEVELELKFAVSSVEVDPDRRGSQALAVGGLLDALSNDLVRALAMRLGDSAESSEGGFRLDPAGERLRAELRSPQLWQRIAEDIYYFLHGHQDRLVSADGSLEARRIAREVLGILLGAISAAIGGRIDEASATLISTEANPVTARVLATHAAAFGRWAASAGKSGEPKIEIDVSYNNLRDLPSPVISTVRVKTGIRNYLWTQLEEAGEPPISHLIPE